MRRMHAHLRCERGYTYGLRPLFVQVFENDPQPTWPAPLGHSAGAH
jgi:hypothetical protein